MIITLQPNASECLKMNFSVFFKSWIISKTLLKVYQEKRDFINLFLRPIFFDLQQVYLTNRRLDHFNPTSWQLKQRELAVYFEGNGEQDTSQESKAGFDRCQLISRSY